MVRPLMDIRCRVAEAPQPAERTPVQAERWNPRLVVPAITSVGWGDESWVVTAELTELAPSKGRFESPAEFHRVGAIVGIEGRRGAHQLDELGGITG